MSTATRRVGRPEQFTLQEVIDAARSIQARGEYPSQVAVSTELGDPDWGSGHQIRKAISLGLLEIPNRKPWSGRKP